MSLPASTADAGASAGAGSAVLFLPAVFLGSLLLFVIEPMIAKMILPWFGGAAEVWIACLLFFQIALLAGYLYAHFLTRWATPPQQRAVHIMLLALSVALLPAIPSVAWKPTGAEPPLGLILGLLAATIGGPYLLLAATSPLLQSWLAQGETRGRVSPYRLYALSNIGSLLALLSYPVVIEPLLATGLQARLWSAAYLAFVAICGVTAWATREDRTAPAAAAARKADAGTRPLDWLGWFLFAACGSTLLMAITNHLTQNVAAIPLLWVIPLALYLLSFILCFDNDRWYPRTLFCILFAEFAAAMIYGAGGHHANSGLYILLPLYLVGLFVACMMCHGELAAMRPRAERLTGFYLMIALGGAAGGVFVGAIAPAIFPALYELPLSLGATAALAIASAWRRARPLGRTGRGMLAVATVAWIVVGGWAAFQAAGDAHGAILQVRNFYGALQVIDQPASAGRPAIRRLMHGTIAHGEQFADPARAMEPTTYYARTSGIGVAMAVLQRGGPMKVGIVGLGAGTLAAYGGAGDDFRFYEIDPLVAQIATRDFSFLRRTPARIGIVLGDGRLRLEAEPAQSFNLLVVDAFSGDAIPVHLLTTEAFALYARHLARRGVIAVHVSNQYLDLAPVVAEAAAQIGQTARLMTNASDPANDVFPANWVLVADAGFFTDPAFRAARPIVAVGAPWTDDYSNLWRRLK